MIKKKKTVDESSPKFFLLDASVLVHDPAAIVRLKENHVEITAILLEELDGLKTVPGEVGKNSRDALRFIEELLHQAGENFNIDEGIPLSLLHSVILSDATHTIAPTGKLFFQNFEVNSGTGVFKKDIADNEYLAVAKYLKDTENKNVVIISNDRNMRIKSRVQKIPCQLYRNDQTLNDIELLYRGTFELPSDFKEAIIFEKEWVEGEFTHYEIKTDLAKFWFPNQYLYCGTDEYTVLSNTKDSAHIRTISDFYTKNVYGITAKSREQNFALNALTDPNIDFVSLAGQAGSGKTILALAAAIECVLERRLYKKIIFTREIIPLGKDPGMLPGTEEEKIAPWLGGLYNNLEVLNEGHETKKGDPLTDKAMKDKLIKNPYLNKIIDVKLLSLMKGCSLPKTYFILDETQDLTAKQAKELGSRAGEGSKVVFMGNLAQSSNPYLSATSSGLAHFVDKMKTYEYGAHITLLEVRRSRLAEFIANNI